ncbi:MAG: AraC family transcriptional regulator [Sinobacteraceae bacterium]|nr:AraC family transcriptional regulator [Nevskiaceae bacterium]
MPAQTTILHPVVISQVIVNFAARYDVDIDTCLLGTGITEDQLHDPDALIACGQEMRLVENLILAVPNVPALGFELGLEYNVATFGIWGFALRISRNLREAIQCAVRYLPLSTAYCRFSIFSDERSFGVSADPSEIPQNLREFLLQRDTATATNLFRELGLSGLDIQRLEYAGPAPPDHAQRIEQLCGIAARFKCPRNAIVMRREDAEAQLPMYDAHLASFLESQCRTQLERRQATGVTEQVRQLLLGPLGLVTSFEDVANQLTMAPRTLRRKLEEQGTTYRTIVDTERKQLATQMLEGTDIKLDVLALQLGYGDTPSFARACHRWFGQAPGEYRKTHAA